MHIKSSRHKTFALLEHINKPIQGEYCLWAAMVMTNYAMVMHKLGLWAAMDMTAVFKECTAFVRWLASPTVWLSGAFPLCRGNVLALSTLLVCHSGSWGVGCLVRALRTPAPAIGVQEHPGCHSHSPLPRGSSPIQHSRCCPSSN
jgi:hypothetical protein